MNGQGLLFYVTLQSKKGGNVLVVYKITNLINKKIYIGQTKNFKNRIRQHERGESKKISLISLAIKKYGTENFTKEIVFESTCIKQINEKEEELISFFKTTDRKFGYNIKKGGGNHEHSEETRVKISKAQLGCLNHAYGKKGKLSKSSKPLMELKTKKIYESVTEAAEKLNLNFSHIASVCRGKRSSTGGFVFRYLDEELKVIEVDSPRVNRAKSILNKTTGEVFESFKQISEKLGRKIDAGNIIKNINGKIKSSYGSTWSYVDF